VTPMEHPDHRADVENPDVRFEHLDVEQAIVARFGAGLVALTVVTAGVAVWLLVFLRHHEEAQDPGRPPLYYSSEQRQPEGVRLQTSPFADLQALHEKERQALTTYGWVDQPSGVVHIPIEQAMRLYVARQAAASPRPGLAASGLPTDSAPVPSPMAMPSPSAPANASPPHPETRP